MAMTAKARAPTRANEPAAALLAAPVATGTDEVVVELPVGVTTAALVVVRMVVPE